MVDPSKSKRPILEAVFETAKDLESAGVITKQRLKYYQLACEEEVPHFSSEQIRRIREKSHISQTVFAMLLNVSVSAVQKWESGTKSPSGPSRKLIHLLDQKGLEVLL